MPIDYCCRRWRPGRGLPDCGLGLRRFSYLAGPSSDRRAARGHDRKRDRGNHEDNGRPGRRLGQRGGGARRAEGGLASHAAKCRRNVAALAALQQHDNDQEEANDNVDNGDQYNHAASNCPSERI